MQWLTFELRTLFSLSQICELQILGYLATKYPFWIKNCVGSPLETFLEVHIKRIHN